MSLHLALTTDPTQAVCGNNSARLTSDPLHPNMSCRPCEAIVQSVRQGLLRRRQFEDAHPNTMIGRR